MRSTSTTILTNDSNFFPMLAQDFQSNYADLWNQLDKIDPKVKKGILHSETPDVIFTFCKKHHFNAEQSKKLSLLIRDIALAEVDDVGIKHLIQDRFSHFNPHLHSQIHAFLGTLFASFQKLENNSSTSPSPKDDVTLEENSSSQFRQSSQKFPLFQALSKFPKLSGQLITSHDLTMRGNPQPVRPTVKNWITVYQQEIGPAPHEPYERSQFLFHNQNALKLPKEERDILNTLLESLDENRPIAIDPVSQTIIWNELTSLPQERKRSVPTSPTSTLSPDILESSSLQTSPTAGISQSALEPISAPSKLSKPSGPENTQREGVEGHFKKGSFTIQKKQPSGLRIGMVDSEWDEGAHDMYTFNATKETALAKNIRFSSGHTLMSEDEKN